MYLDRSSIRTTTTLSHTTRKSRCFYDHFLDAMLSNLLAANVNRNCQLQRSVRVRYNNLEIATKFPRASGRAFDALIFGHVQMDIVHLPFTQTCRTIISLWIANRLHPPS